jgi:hypothetical protein
MILRPLWSRTTMDCLSERRVVEAATGGGIVTVGFARFRQRQRMRRLNLSPVWTALFLLIAFARKRYKGNRNMTHPQTIKIDTKTGDVDVRGD